MNLHQLIIFNTVCETMSITKAAQALYMTQPAVSHTILSLEKELGFQLFDRISRKIYLTAPGTVFHQKTHQLLNLYKELENTSESLSKTAPLLIGSSITLSGCLLSPVLSIFQKQYPDKEIRVIVDNARAIENKIKKNELDFALTEGVMSSSQIHIIPLSAYAVTAVCSVSHPVALNNEISLPQLLEEKLLVREMGSAVRDTFDSALMLHGYSCSPYWTSVNTQTLIQAAADGLGIAIIPQPMLKLHPSYDRLKQLKITDLELSCPNQIIYLKNKYQSPTALCLIEQLQAYPLDFSRL